MHKMRPIITYLFLAVILAGCSSKEKNKVPRQFRSLKNLKVYPADVKPVQQIQLTKEQAFGNSGKVMIGLLGDIAVDSLGRVFIADIQKRVIDVFNPDGRFLTQLGRKGKGPGEFVTLTGVQIRNKYLYAYDGRQQEVKVFTLYPLASDKTIIIAQNRGNYPALNRAFPFINNLYVRNNHTYLAEYFKDPNAQKYKKWQNLEYKRLFFLLDRAGDISSNKLFDIDETMTEVGGIIDNVKVFFGRPMIILSSKNNIYVSNEHDYFLIKIYNHDGMYRRAFYYPHPKVPLTPKSVHNGGVTNTHFRHGFLLKYVDNMNLPQNWPIINDMKIDNQDRLWVATTVKNMKVYQWWVLNSQGKLLARFEWPRSNEIEVVKDGKLYAVEKNPKTGVQQIVRYQIEMK